MLLLGNSLGSTDTSCAMATATSATVGSTTDTTGVTCCDANGVGSRPDCKVGDFYAAEAHCAANSLTLCTVAQIQAGAGQGMGCQFDDKPVWTSDTCGMSRTLILALSLQLVHSGAPSAVALY